MPRPEDLETKEFCPRGRGQSEEPISDENTTEVPQLWELSHVRLFVKQTG